MTPNKGICGQGKLGVSEAAPRVGRARQAVSVTTTDTDGERKRVLVITHLVGGARGVLERALYMDGKKKENFSKDSL